MPFGIGGGFGKSKSKTKATTRTGNNVADFLRGHFEGAAQGATDLFNRGPQVYEGQRVADFSPETEEAFDLTRRRGRATQGQFDQVTKNILESAQGRNYLPPEIQDLVQSAGDSAVQGAFGRTAQQFQGRGGGINSPLAQAAISRAGSRSAAETALPVYAQLFGQEGDRREAAIRDAGGIISQGATGPGDILRQIGLQREGREQAVLQGEQDEFGEREDARAGGVEDYINSLLGIGQLFRKSTTKAKGKTKGKSFNLSGKAESSGSPLAFLGGLGG